MSPTTRSRSGGGSPPSTPTAPNPTRKRGNSSSGESVRGVSKSPSTPSKRQKRNPARLEDSPRTPSKGSDSSSPEFFTPRQKPIPRLDTIPTELVEKIIDKGLPAAMPVHLHAYNGGDNDLVGKVYLTPDNEDADAWRSAIAFKRVANSLKTISRNQVKRLIQSRSYLYVDLGQDPFILNFPSLLHGEEASIRPVSDDILNTFERIQFSVPLAFRNERASAIVLIQAKFTFTRDSGVYKFWYSEDVEWTPLIIKVTSATQGSTFSQSFAGRDVETLLQWMDRFARLNTPDFRALRRTMNEHFRGTFKSTAKMGRGVSRDLLTLQCALTYMPLRITETRHWGRSDEDPPIDWYPQHLRYSIEMAQDEGFL